MKFRKCSTCGRLLVARTVEELDEMERQHAELDQAALSSLRKLFPRWVEADGDCRECYSNLQQIVREPLPAY